MCENRFHKDGQIMKYNILINQVTWKSICPKADFRHAVVLIAIRSLCHSVSDKMVRTGDGYTWISSSKILAELPMLRITTKAGLSPIIKDLSDWGMIDILHEKGGKQYYKITLKAESVERKNDKDSEQVLDSPNAPLRGSNRKRSQNLTDPYTRDQDTIDHRGEGELIDNTTKEGIPENEPLPPQKFDFKPHKRKKQKRRFVPGESDEIQKVLNAQDFPDFDEGDYPTPDDRYRSCGVQCWPFWRYLREKHGLKTTLCAAPNETSDFTAMAKATNCDLSLIVEKMILYLDSENQFYAKTAFATRYLLQDINKLGNERHDNANSKPKNSDAGHPDFSGEIRL